MDYSVTAVATGFTCRWLEDVAYMKEIQKCIQIVIITLVKT